MSTPEEPTCGDDEPVSDDEWLAERERLAEAATKGPWDYDDGVDVCSDGSSHPYQEKNRPAGVFKPSGPTVFTDDDVSDANANAIVDALNHQPSLIAESAGVASELALGASLEFSGATVQRAALTAWLALELKRKTR